MSTSVLNVRLFDGTGQLFPTGTQVLVTIRDGNQKEIVRKDFFAGQITIKGLPFYDNYGDNYAVIACIDGYKQAGYAPVKLSPDAPVNIDLMLVPDEHVFNFAGLNWDAAKQRMPFLVPLPGQSDTDAQQRFSELMETNGSKSLACMMNIVAAMNGIDLEGRTPTSFIKQIRWDFKPPAQDRFFAYCDSALIDAVRAAAANGQFDAEHGCGLVHPGASLSWKHNAFSEANIQLTFHTDPMDCVPAEGWVTVEPDIDYYKDPGAHAILEVCRNKLSGSLTEPAEVFVLRWIEQRRLGLPDFDPGYTLRPD